MRTENTDSSFQEIFTGKSKHGDSKFKRIDILDLYSYFVEKEHFLKNFKKIFFKTHEIPSKITIQNKTD